jgi:prophage antirepressor-like protein
MVIISEPGLYKLLMTSRKPVARRFDRFRHEVLPQSARRQPRPLSVTALTVVSRASSHATTPLRAAPVNLRVMREETTADLVVADIRNF